MDSFNLQTNPNKIAYNVYSNYNNYNHDIYSTK